MERSERDTDIAGGGKGFCIVYNCMYIEVLILITRRILVTCCLHSSSCVVVCVRVRVGVL